MLSGFYFCKRFCGRRPESRDLEWRGQKGRPIYRHFKHRKAFVVLLVGAHLPIIRFPSQPDQTSTSSPSHPPRKHHLAHPCNLMRVIRPVHTAHCNVLVPRPLSFTASHFLPIRCNTSMLSWYSQPSLKSSRPFRCQSLYPFVPPTYCIQ